MKVWIDNTGLQAAGSSLTEEPTHSIEGLLQLATLVAFSDVLSLNAFEGSTVAAKSAEVKDVLTSIGLDPRAIDLVRIAPESYAVACEQAAAFCRDKLSEAFLPSQDSTSAEFPPSLSEEEVHTQVTRGLQVLFCNDAKLLEDFRAESLDMKASGAVAYMLSSDGQLRVAARDLIAAYEGSWNVWRQVENFLRYHLNQELAQQADASYAPSVGRARVIRANATAVGMRIAELLDGLSERLKGRALHIPSIHRYLLRQSGGDPHGVVYEALRVRAETTTLRTHLRSRLSRSSSATQHASLEREIAELGRELEAQLGLREEPTWQNAIDISFVIGLPPIAITASSKKLKEWWDYRSAQARNAILTDISREC
ncbi:MAG: hypothetical protein AAFR95_13195 [Bacteroidota bacterium]